MCRRPVGHLSVRFASRAHGAGDVGRNVRIDENLAEWHGRPRRAPWARPLPGFKQKTWFDTADYVASNVLLPIGAVLTSLLVGWRLPRIVVAEELPETAVWVRQACIFLLRFLCPIAILAVLIAKLLG